MNGPRALPSGGPVRAGLARVLVTLLVGTLLAAGCDRPFEPLAENLNGPFSITGYLDLSADTQWVRVMPVRQTLLATPEPIDAVVTLQHVGNGRSVSLRDSIFSYSDARLGAEVYAHVFWTTEPLEPKARYRITATRSDGAASSVRVDVPDELELVFLNLRDTAYVEVGAERLLLVESFHAMRTPIGEPGPSATRRHFRPPPFGDPPRHGVIVDGAPLFREGLVDVRRMEVRVTTTGAAWPAELRTPSAVPGPTDTLPSNVENGLGFVGGIATRTLPFTRCDVLAFRADPRYSACTLTYDRNSTRISGRVIRLPCNRPHQLAEVGLRATYADGGSALLRWRTGWGGEYRFDGIEPGAELVLQIGPGSPGVRLPRLAPGQRYSVPDMFVSQGC